MLSDLSTKLDDLLTAYSNYCVESVLLVPTDVSNRKINKAEAKEQILQAMLQEALEILDTPALSKAINAKINELETITYHKHHYVRKTGLKRAIKDTARQELRNKFNDKYKED